MKRGGDFERTTFKEKGETDWCSQGRDTRERKLKEPMILFLLDVD